MPAKSKTRKNAPVEADSQEEYTEEWDSDALDDDAPKKRKLKKKKTSPKKKVKTRRSDEEDVEEDLKEGQTVVGEVVKPPKEGWGACLDSPAFSKRR